MACSLLLILLPVGAAADGVATATAMTVNGVEGIWFPKAEAQRLLLLAEAQPHSDALSSLALKAYSTAAAVVETSSASMALSKKSLALCEGELASCRGDSSGLLASPIFSGAAGLVIGTGLCALTAKAVK